MYSNRNTLRHGLFYIALIALGSLLGVYITKKGLFDHSKKSDVTFIEEYENTIKKYRDSLELYTLNEYLINYKLTTPDNEKLFMKEIVNETIVIYRFNEFSCSPCIENDFLILSQLADSIGYERVVVISKLSNSNILKIYLSNYDIRLKSFNLPDLFNLPIEMDAINDSPYYILVSRDLKVEFAYTSTPSHTINNLFFTRVIQYLNKK